MQPETKSSLLIYLINYDWRDIFRSDHEELWEKLVRDNLAPDFNRLFFHSYAHVGYHEKHDTVETVHIKTRLKYLKPLLDMTTLVRAPYYAWRYGVRPDVWAVADFGAVPGAWLAKKLFGGTVVMSINNEPVRYSRVRKFGFFKSLYTRLIQTLFHGLVDRYFTINTTLRDYLVSAGVPQDTITIFSMNTIVRDAKHITQARKGVIRTQFGLRPDNKVLVTVGRLEAEKNWEKSIALFATLPKEYVLFCLGMGSLEQKLKDLTKQHGVEDRVFFPGFVQRSDIWNYYLDADAFVLLSRVEALGIVFWEAMYVGLPCVGSDVPGIMESLGEDGERGRIYREEDGVEGYQEQVRFCVTPSTEREAMCKRARAYVEEHIRSTVSINDIATPRASR